MDPAFSKSTALGRPSFTLNTTLHAKPAARNAAAVPRVATSWNPSATNLRATATASGLWCSFTLMNTVPFSGSGVPAPICALANASPKLAPTHHFARRSHLRPQRGVHAREFVERKHRRFFEVLRHRQHAGGEPARVDLIRPTDTAADIVATFSRALRDRARLERGPARRGAGRGSGIPHPARRPVGRIPRRTQRLRFRDRHRRLSRPAPSPALPQVPPELLRTAGLRHARAGGGSRRHGGVSRGDGGGPGGHAGPARTRRALPAAVWRARTLSVQDGFRRSRVHFARAQRRERPLQLSPGGVGDEAQDGATGAGTGAPDRSHAAVGRGYAEAVSGQTSRSVRMGLRPTNRDEKTVGQALGGALGPAISSDEQTLPASVSLDAINGAASP